MSNKARSLLPSKFYMCTKLKNASELNNLQTNYQSHTQILLRK